MARLLAYAGAGLWVATFAFVVQRQRVLARRLARVEHRLVAAAPPVGRKRTVVTLRSVGFNPNQAAKLMDRELRRHRFGG